MIRIYLPRKIQAYSCEELSTGILSFHDHKFFNKVGRLVTRINVHIFSNCVSTPFTNLFIHQFLDVSMEEKKVAAEMENVSHVTKTAAFLAQRTMSPPLVFSTNGKRVAAFTSMEKMKSSQNNTCLWFTKIKAKLAK